jgi:hypothetical protein
MKVVRRHGGDLGQPGQVERVVEMIGQPAEDPLQPHRVVAARRQPFVHGAMVEM